VGTAVDARWLEELVAALDTRADYDVAASCVILYDEPELISAAGDGYSLWGMVGTNRGFRQRVADYQSPARVLGAITGAALYRRRLFGEIGDFDEDFFLMTEDTDLNVRAMIAGKKCLYVPTARVRHKLGASIGTRPPGPIERLLVRNHAVVAAKNFPWWLLVVMVALTPVRLRARTLPLTPSHWHLMPARMRLLPRMLSAELEGFVMGLTQAARSPPFERRPCA
jgi:GT2 family glycosyltransferase